MSHIVLMSVDSNSAVSKDIEQFMQQPQGMQQRMLSLKVKLGGEQVSQVVGEGSVRFSCTGRKEPVAIKLDLRELELSDATLLEGLIMLTIQSAAGKTDALLSERTGKIMAEMGLLADFRMPG